GGAGPDAAQPLVGLPGRDEQRSFTGQRHVVAHVSCVSPRGQNQPAVLITAATAAAVQKTHDRTTRPRKMPSSAMVSSSGQADSWGMGATTSGSASSRLVTSVLCPPPSPRPPASGGWPWGPSSGWSHIGSRLRTVGTFSKLYSAGGDVVAHSSVSPRQGSCPAG